MTTVAAVCRRRFLLGLVGSMVAGSALARGAHAATLSRRAASLGPLINIPQTYNNCGPAAVAEVLAYWGFPRRKGKRRQCYASTARSWA
jgi:hypothetical protein